MIFLKSIEDLGKSRKDKSNGIKSDFINYDYNVGYLYFLYTKADKKYK